MRRTGTLVLGAGFAVLLALAVGLVAATRGAGPEAAQLPARAPSAPAAPAPAAASPAAAPPAAAAAREHPAAAAPRVHAQTAAPRPELPAAGLGFHRDLKRDANGHLVPIIPYTELRARLALTDAPMRACIQQSGQRPTGKATLAFTVAARGDRLVIESTAVDDQDSLGAFPELLECMHRTAGALAPVLEGRPVPELGTPIYVRRKVQIDGGALVDNSYVNFSYSP